MKPMIIANWKANTNFEMFNDLPNDCNNIEICVAVPHVYIQKAKEYSKDYVSIAAQDCSIFGVGPHTGETPAEFLKRLGVEYVIIGHSERRLNQKEDSQTLSAKIKQALAVGLKVIYCIGENAKERENKTYLKALYDQFFSVVGQDINIDISYEPLYSIGTGVLPAYEDLQEVIDNIAKWAKGINVKGRILYGGSLSLNNIEGFAQLKGLSGYLVGSTSLRLEFIDMIRKLNDMKFH